MKKIVVISMLAILLLAGIASAGILQEGKAWQSKSGIREGSAATGNAVVGDFFKKAQSIAVPPTPIAVPQVQPFNVQSCGELAVQNNALLQLIAKKLGISQLEMNQMTANAIKKLRPVAPSVGEAKKGLPPQSGLQNAKFAPVKKGVAPEMVPLAERESSGSCDTCVACIDGCDAIYSPESEGHSTCVDDCYTNDCGGCFE